jgi:hypothetical protein
LKRAKFALSVLLVPALVIAGTGGGTTTCTSGSGASTAPTFNLPATVLGVQVATGTPTTFDLTLSGVPAGLSIANTTYGAWCTNPSGFRPSEIVDFSQTPPVLFDPSGVATYNVYNSYAPSTYSAGNDTGFPGPVYGSTQVLTLSAEWNAVNYVLNHLTGTNGNIPATVNDIQGVIWQLLHPDTVGSNLYPTNTFADSNSVKLYNDAIANGTTFRPGNGQFAALILVPQTPAGSPEPFQGVLIPVCVKGGGCTGTSSATLTKTANVSSANPFQLVTYTYVVKNTGTTTLTNIVVTDDNGTPTFSGDDFTVGTIASLAAGKSVTFTATVYLPIKLFFQNGSTGIWDTLIPQVPTTPSNALILMYLQDPDISDNTYSSGGSDTFGALLDNYAEFVFFDAKGNLVSDFKADYISPVTKSSMFPSGYGAGLQGNMVYGSSKYIDYITSTLSQNLNGYPKFYNDEVNSPIGDNNWQNLAAYEVTVDKGIFGWYGMGGAAIKTNYLGASKCGAIGSYTPLPVCSRIVNTAYLCAGVQNCCTIIHASASVCVTVNGITQPTCSQSYQHKCQHQEECRCNCANCLAGNHDKCTQSNCSDARCADKGCPQQCQCHCVKCSSGDHAHCIKIGCKDTICHKKGCPQ